jgi:hypothetical protein
LEGYAVLNGARVASNDTQARSFQGVFTHESGHGINLAHSETVGAVFAFFDWLGPSGCAIPFSLPVAGLLETMYPFLFFISVGPFAQGTVDHPDDIAAISNIYPEIGWPDASGTITGKIFASDGVTEVTGVNVIARNIADPGRDCVSAISGDYTQGTLGPDGLFTINGLTPGAEYVLYTDGLEPGAFSTPPAMPFPGREEYFNGILESHDPAVDDICDFTPIVATSGSPVIADIVFNDQLNLVDDDFVEVPLPFTFPFCGRTFDSVFVASNGYLTFGRRPVLTSPSVSDLVTWWPRIAPLWNLDLSPFYGGSITAREVTGAFQVSWNAIPQYPDWERNTFSVTLRADGSFDFDYGSLSPVAGGVDVIVGISPGCCITEDPGETDLSAASGPIVGAPGEAIYEVFSSSDNDLAGAHLEWAPCTFDVAFSRAEEEACYGTTNYSSTGGPKLVAVDPTTGATTTIGSTGIPSALPGVAIDSQGQIYAAGNELLWWIDAQTADALLVSNVVVGAIAFDQDDVLYGILRDSPDFTLAIIDPETGDALPIGPTGVSINGLAFDPTDGQLYGCRGFEGDSIYRIDKTTGCTDLVGTTGLGTFVQDLHFDATGNLYGSTSQFSVSGVGNLIAIDRSSGTGAVIGSTSVVVRGLASRVSPVESEPIAIDIKPHSCPNAFNPGANGVLTVAILGTALFDVNEMDAGTIVVNGASPIRSSIEDVSTRVVSGTECGCNKQGADGFDDLVLKFNREAIVPETATNECLPQRTITLLGRTFHGALVQGSDCVVITPVGNGQSASKALAVPRKLYLAQNYPNPFNPTTTVEFGVPKATHLTLTVYNLRGQMVRSLVSGAVPAGQHQVVWDGTSNGGQRVGSGIYVYRLKTDEYEIQRKLVLLK